MHRKPTRLDKVLLWLLLLVRKAGSTNPKKVKATLFQVIVKGGLELAGFAWLTYAGFSVNSVTGGVVAGISCLIMSWHFDKEQPSTATNRGV